MFIVYTPEGRNRIQPGELRPELKVDRSKRINAVGESEMDQLHFDETLNRMQDKPRPAVKEYESIQHDQPRHPVFKVFDIMTQPVITISHLESQGQAWSKMLEAGVHHLPVVNDRAELVGLVSSRDILMRATVGENGQLEIGGDEPVANVMNRKVITTKAETDIRRVALVMSEYRLGCVVIMSEAESIRGIVTQSDIVRRIAAAPPLEIYA
ncbi:MAG: HPP family protein [Hydrogenovibrio sp.]